MLEIFSKQISEKLDGIGRKKTLTQDDLKKSLREIQMLLLEADVNLKVAKEFILNINEKAISQNILIGLNPGEQVVKIVKDEMIDLLSGDNQLKITNSLDIIMMVGLQGSGKTTSSAKVASFLRKKKRKNKILLVAADVYRPAAIDQLKTLGKQLSIDVFSLDTKDVAKIAKEAHEYARSEGYDLVIFDTAGRMHVDNEMMDEIKALHDTHKPCETLLVVDGSIGQAAVDIASTFNEYVNITGLIFTKMDSDTRGGAIFSVKKTIGSDIKFLGISEKLDGLEEFEPTRVVGRILGDGDVFGLIEKAEEFAEDNDTEKMAKKMLDGKFDFNDFLAQLKMMKKMGGLSSILSMLPGKMKLDKSQIDEKQFVKVQAIIESMTAAERKNANVLNAKRKIRIANGSGTTVQDVNRLIKQYEQSKKMMKQMKNMDMSKMANMFK